MLIRNYTDEDEKAWLKCRLLSFYDCSYFDDIQHTRQKYENESICLVAEKNKKICGFIDVEIEKQPKDVCYLKGDLGGVIWNLGVLPQYRDIRVATLLLETAKIKAREKNITRFEAWTQDDVVANNWYMSRGFKYIEGYLNVYATGTECKKHNLISSDIGNILGVRGLNFETNLGRKEEMISKFNRVHEVRLYELKFN